MKKSHRFLAVGLFAVLVTGTAVLMRVPHDPAPGPDVRAGVPTGDGKPPAELSNPEHTAPMDAAKSAATPEVAPPEIGAWAYEKPREPDFSKLAAFDNWIARWKAATSEERLGMVEEGSRLAGERRPEFKALISYDPRRALQEAVPRVVRQDLPVEILNSLEAPISTTGDYTLFLGLPKPGLTKPEQKLEFRTFEAKDGTNYRAYVFGEMESVMWKKQMPVSGVAIDGDLAVAENPVRKLEVGERVGAGTEVEEVCPVSGETTMAVGSGEPVTEEVPTVQIGERVITLCDGSHVAVLEEQYRTKIQASGPGGAGVFVDAFPGTTSRAIGNFRCLYIRLAYPDQLSQPNTEGSACADMANVARYYLESSYGKMTTTSVVTPLVILPHTKAWYLAKDGVVDGLGLIHTDARAEARKLGYDSNQYDCIIVRVNGGPKLSGASWGGGNSVWVSWDGMDVLNHECGHSLGLNHANYWISTDGTGYGNGANQEYGNPFDVMGGGFGYSAQYNTISKRAVGWLPAAYVHQPQTNGVFRLYAYDQPQLEEGKRYALSVTKDSVRKYNVEFHPARGGLLADSAMVLYSGLGSSAGHLLDLTPGSAGGKDDGGIAIGRTFSDLEADIHFTVLGKNGTNPPSLDVAYFRGPFPGNLPPTLSLGASATTISAGGNVTFTATASDPNGDPLAYRWEFDDGVVGTNSPVFTRSFANVAQITAMLTVSDMKGGTARRHVVINVGSHGKQTVNGNVSWNAQPLPGVRITGGGKSCYTDTDGNYALSGVVTGSQALTATLNGYTFTPQFTNPLAVVSGANTANWTAGNTTNFVTLTRTADATEGGGNGTFTLTRSGDISAALTVRTQPGGTAVKTTDYTMSPDWAADGSYRSFTIPAGQASLDITVTAVNDTLAEGPETITIQLASNGTYLSNNANVAVMTVQDNDTALPQVAVTATDWYATESSTDPGVFVFSRTGSTAGALDLSVSWQGAALNGTDYSLLPSTVTIPAGQSSTTVNVSTIQDSEVEAPEDVVATINATPNNWVRLVRSGTLITGYRSSDGVNWSVQGSATVSMTSTVSMGLAVSSSSTSLVATATFDKLTLNGVPVSGLTGTNIGTAGLGGSMSEAGGGFTVRGSGGDISGTADSFHFANIGLTGDGDLRVRVTSLSTNATWTKGGVMIREATAAGSKNCFMGIGGAAAIHDFQSRTATDAATAATTGNAVNAGGAYVCDMSARTASAIITDDDQATISVSVPDSSAAEAGPDSGVFLITRTGSTAAPLKVYYGLSGTALHGTDYAQLNGEVIIPAGSASAPVFITPYDDDLGEPEYETVTLAVTTFNSAYTLGSVFSGTINIRDNNDAPVVTVRLNGNGYEVGSSGSVIFQRTGTGSGSGNVTVNYTVSGTATAGSDYTALTGTVTIPASGATEVTVPITILDDALAEPTETIVITITPSAAYRVYNDASATVTIVDNESGANLVTVSTWNDAPAEQGTAGGRFYFSRGGSVGDLTVNYTLSGTATNGVDYAALPGSVLIPDGQSGADILVAPVDDALAEGTETVIVSVAPGTGYSAYVPATATYNLADNDPVAVTVGFAAATGSTTEAPGVLGEYRDLPVNLSAASADTITVNYAAGGGTASGDDVDWAFVNAVAGNAIIRGGMLTFPPGTTTQNIRIRVKNDDVSEPSETAVISLSQPYRASLAGGLSSHTLTITDVSSAEPYSVRFATSATTRTEADGTEPDLMVLLDRPAGTTPITVDYTVGGTATAGSDYLLAPGSVTFAPGEQVKPLSLAILTDSIGEAPEAIVVTLSNPTNAQIGVPASHTITLIESDAPTVANKYFLAASTMSAGTVVGTVTATAPAGRTMAGWSIVGGNFGNAFSVNASGQIALSAPSSLPNPGTIQLVVRATDSYGAIGEGVVNIACNESSLRAWWRLDETSGTLADDSTGNPYDATLVNAPTWTPGFAGGALTFNGTNQAAQVPALGMNTNTLTISAWVKRNGSQSAWAGLVFTRTSPILGLSIAPGNLLRYDCNTNKLISGLVIPDNTWTFCALVIEPTKATMYMQPIGEPMQSEVNNVPHAATAFSTGIYLGRDPLDATRYFDGQLDEVRVYGRSLSAADLALEVEAPPSVAITAPVGGAVMTAPGSMTIDATVHGGPEPITTVEFYRGSTLIGSDSTAPYSVNWNNTQAGNFVLTARAVCNGGSVDSASVSITATSHAPVFTADPIAGASATEDAAYSGTLAGSATDVDAGDSLTYTKVSGPAWLNVASNGTLSGTPINSNVGANAFTVRVTDSLGLTDNATLNISVANTNDAPGFTVDPIVGAGATEDAAYSDTLAGSAADVDAGDTVTYTKVSGPTWLNVASGGALSGTPSGSDGGLNSFSVRATDAAGASDTATLQITVTIIAWANPAGGSWTNSGNWNSGIIANGPNKVANFATLDLTANGTVTLDGARTIGNVMFGDATPSHHWTLNTGSGGPLSLQTSAGTPGITVVNQTATIGAVLAGTQGFIKMGAGALTLGAANTYTGITTIEEGRLIVTGKLGGSTAHVASGATLELNSATYNGTSTQWSGGLTGSGTAEIAYGSSGSGQMQRFTGNNTAFGGTVNVLSGKRLNLENINSSSANAEWIADGTLSTQVANGTFSFGALSGGGSLGTGGTGTNPLHKIGALNTNTTFSGTIIGTVKLEKVGTGTLTLSGVNSYTGATTVNSGTLSVTGTLGATATTVQSGGTLGGTGTIGGSVTVQSGGTLAPGVSTTGTLAINNTLTLAGTTAMQIGRTGSTLSGDKVAGITTATYGGTLTVTDVGGNALQVGDAFRLFAATTYSGSFGTVTLPSLASGLTWNTSRLSTDGYISVQGTLPGGWTGADIGSTGVPGGAHFASGVYTVSGSGAAIGGTADAFQSVSQSLTGDGEIRARVTSQTNTNAAALAGVMLRDGSTAGAVNATMGLTPSGFVFQSRSTSGGSTTQVGTAAANTAPNNWVRLTRSGSLVTAYVSANGTTWTLVGSTSLTMGSTLSASLAVTSHDNAVSSTATFDNVSVTPYPSPWLTSDLGTTGVAGRSEYFGSTHTLNGAGVIGGTVDGLRFTYQTLSADGQIVARVPAFSNTGSGTRVGVMIRDTLAAGSKEIFIGADGSGAFTWVRRTATGGSTTTSSSGSGSAPNIWLKLVRSGNDITASTSADGTTWNTVGTTTVTMASNCYVGLAVGSGNTSGLNASSFDNVSVTP